TQDIKDLTPFVGMGESPVAKEVTTEMMIIGVGGGGGNAVRYMYNTRNIEGIRYVVCNTDSQALEKSGIPTQLLLGPNVTKGGGAGNKPDVARAAAEESEEDIKALLSNDPMPNMVFVTAGMGGGTGTGAAPVVARVAKELGILTVGIVTLPFLFEGLPKIKKALSYIEEMRKHVDALLVINNERLREIYPNLTFMNAFSKADDILATAAGSIIEIIIREGYVNCDFRDVRTTLLDGGTAIISTGYGEGENRVTSAIEDAIRSPLLKNADVYTSRNLLIVVYLSPDEDKQMTLAESDELTAFTSKFVNAPDVITGIYFDESIGDKMKITILASGFEATDTITITAPAPSKNDKKAEPATPAEVDSSAVEQIYGQDAVRDVVRKRLQIALLTREQMDNDAILELFDSEPTYNRSSDFKQRLAVAGTVRPNESNATSESGTKTINFGD
ncbi:MAG: cell division protein FtsZ, partial [Bacteroidaceae bacterium]|nr:cell division protein FtsZ [Bacteroidaceae bacterium]